ncbi:hypothetical protein [Paenibacillus sp. UASWS1643]|uniref:hypothetical protein n=1 Tax=Paenibacillus sp. UASWS1643 TaxID=2580422 RepID=UPI0012399BF3|nr:hypothetical protein [Paenibacillus sp. UASWS1643]KAA8753960.1 hypothetical protein FE296_12090 [Paenibacillus sp. UASWS1643]
MEFDLNGFTSAIIGTLGALGAVYLTVHLQDKRNKPVLNKGRYRIVVNAFIVMTEARNKILYTLHEEEPLDAIANEAILLQDKLFLLEADAIECDLELHDALSSMCLYIQDMLSKYGDQSEINERSTDTELAEEFKLEFKDLTNNYSKYFGNLKEEIRNAVR